MALIVDEDDTPFHFVAGTLKADTIVGNGTRGSSFFGGGGDDNINPGINFDQTWEGQIGVYGGVSKVGFNENPIEGDGIGTLRNDGNDHLHIGSNIEGIGGDGANIYELHGFFRDLKPSFIRGFSDRDDTIIMVNDDRSDFASGVEVRDIDIFGVVGSDGSTAVHVKSLLLRGHSNGLIDIQKVRVGLSDDLPREDLPDVFVPYTGTSYKDEVQAMVDGWVDDGTIL